MMGLHVRQVTKSGAPLIDAATIVYDDNDRVSSITLHDGFASELQNTFEYNGFGLRVEKTDSLGTASFLTDGLTVASPVINDGSAVYTYGLGLTSERRNDATHTYHLDGLGSTRLMTNAGQSITASLAYDAFGNTLNSPNRWAR